MVDPTINVLFDKKIIVSGFSVNSTFKKVRKTKKLLFQTGKLRWELSEPLYLVNNASELLTIYQDSYVVRCQNWRQKANRRCISLTMFPGIGHVFTICRLVWPCIQEDFSLDSIRVQGPCDREFERQSLDTRWRSFTYTLKTFALVLQIFGYIISITQ